MKKTELILNAINKAVQIIDFENEIQNGYLVKETKWENAYLLLPFNINEDVNCYKVSHIKHIKLLSNGYLLW